MLLDSDVMVDVLRGHPPAVTWLASVRSMPLGLPGIAAMELLQGCRTLADQQRLEKQLQPFPRYWPSLLDCQLAYRDFAAFRLSHNLGLLDALIGHTAVGRGEPLATFNVKHYTVIAVLTRYLSA